MATASNIFSLSNRSLKLTTADETQPYLKPLLSPSTPITEIRLNGNTLGVPACEAISSLLRTQTSLQVANLADIFTSRLLSEIPPALEALLTALLHCPNLHTVDLSDNAFGLNTVAPLVAFLKAHVPLKHLILNNNGLGPDAGTLIAEALTELAERKTAVRKEGKDVPELETVVCGRNRLESGSMVAWAKAFCAHANTKVVKMTQNGIRAEGIVTLLRDGLGGCQGLQVLDLQDNTFTVKGSLALADVVWKWTQLQELGVGDCLLGNKGVVQTCAALERGCNGELSILRLQYNEIEERGLEALVRVVEGRQLDGLRRVELNGNRFSEDHERVLRLREILDGRREEAGEEEGHGWGVDDLSDMEESDDEDEKEDENESEKEDENDLVAERILKDADEEEHSKVSAKKDDDVDDLADALGKTGL